MCLQWLVVGCWGCVVVVVVVVVERGVSKLNGAKRNSAKEGGFCFFGFVYYRIPGEEERGEDGGFKIYIPNPE